jgi:nucleoside-diphosphate-sugar epimerase
MDCHNAAAFLVGGVTRGEVMKVFLAGATGAIGKHLVPALVRAGHDVVGTTRSESKVPSLVEAGATPVVLDALNQSAVHQAVVEAQPDVVIHQLTAIANPGFKKFDESFAATNELRTRGLDYLLEAARAVGAKRFIAQSYTGWPNERVGDSVKTEDDPLDASPAAASRKSLAAIRRLEAAVTSASGIEGVVLRYGTFYGTGGTGFGKDGEMAHLVASRKLPIVGGGAGVFSFIHIADAAQATLLAAENGAPGIYNIVDDEPAPVATWLPYLAEVIGAKPPRKVPAWLVRPMLGEFGVNVMTAQRGSSNAKARRELGWTPTYPSWRDGFRASF